MNKKKKVIDYEPNTNSYLKELIPENKFIAIVINQKGNILILRNGTNIIEEYGLLNYWKDQLNALQMVAEFNKNLALQMEEAINNDAIKSMTETPLTVKGN